MLALFFIFTITLSLANTQDHVESVNNDNEAISYGNSSSCIKEYRYLESYVLSNEDLMGELTELFFKTGKSFTDFVKITYKFQILMPVDNSNITNDTRYMMIMTTMVSLHASMTKRSLFGVLLLYICLALNHCSDRHCLLCM